MVVKLPVGSNFAAEQIRRMRGMPGYPSKMSAQEIEMIEALCDNARDEQHAKQIVTQLVRGWRSPNLPVDEQAKEARFCPRVVDIVDAAHADDEPAIAPTQPAEWDQDSHFNPIDHMLDSGWFYEAMTSDLLAGWRQRAADPKFRSHKLAKQIVETQRQRLLSMGEPAWDREREKADRSADEGKRTAVHGNQRGHCAMCADTGFRYTEPGITGTVVVCRCRRGTA